MSGSTHQVSAAETVPAAVVARRNIFHKVAGAAKLRAVHTTPHAAAVALCEMEDTSTNKVVAMTKNLPWADGGGTPSASGK